MLLCVIVVLCNTAQNVTLRFLRGELLEVRFV
nr:MAG TPA: hypothetical protein [Caudoviricetes sp.]